jgi:hypothetical protein
MHNGALAEFDKIKRKLQNSLPDEFYTFPLGNTGVWPEGWLGIEVRLTFWHAQIPSGLSCYFSPS